MIVTLPSFKWITGCVSFFIMQTMLFAVEPLPEIRGIWLSRDVLLADQQTMRVELKKIKDAGYNTVFVNNWYQGAMIYESDVLEKYGGVRQHSGYVGRDPMSEVIEEAHRLNLDVHAWFEYGLWNWLSYDSSNVGPIFENHPDWLMIDKHGRKYSMMAGSIYQFWMDPAHPDVVTFMTEIFVECAEKYPNLDGIQTDRIRYPSLDFSYSSISRSTYMSETGGKDPLDIVENEPEWQDFVAWRKRKTSDLAKTIYEAVKAVNPSCLVSAAVAAPYMMEGSQDKLQDWPTWGRERSVDLLCPMLYGLHDQMLYWLDRCFQLYDDPLRYAPGFDIGSVENELIYQTVSAIHEKNAAGAITWDYGDLTDEKRTFFGSTVYPQSVQPFYKSPTVDDMNNHYVVKNNMQQMTGGFKGIYHIGTEGSSFSWHIPLYISGNYLLQSYIPEEWTRKDTLYYQVEWNQESVTLSVPCELSGDWLTLLNQSFTYNDIVTVSLLGSSSGIIVADAIRLKQKEPLNILDGFTPNDKELRLLFNYPLNRYENSLSSFTIFPHVSILSMTIHDDNPKCVTLGCSGFVPGQLYTLTAYSVMDEEGNISDTLIFSFQYYTGLDTVIDNTDTYFTIQTGTWIEETEVEGFTGENYLTTPTGDGSARVYWRYLAPANGFYQIIALFPAHPEFASEAMYILKNGLTYDTLRVDQSRPEQKTSLLGTQWLDEGTYAVVKLHNDCPQNPGKRVVADAIHFARIFPSEVNHEHSNFAHPADFDLQANYPNPFNNITRFSYTMRKKGDVKFQIFNLQGKKIMTYSQNLDPGHYTLDLDFSAESSGIYFYQASAAGIIVTGKMLHIK